MLSPKHYKKSTHLNNLITDEYYRDLVLLRNTVEMACDEYFQNLKAPKVDLFLIAKGVSSPMGRGSDSLPIPFKLGEQEVFLVDSAQFGMEPLVLNFFDMVYCYLPSFRGEESDNRHLNQFYHCEAELRGELPTCMEVAENLVKYVLEQVILKSSSAFKSANLNLTKKFIEKKFPQITFDDAVELLEKSGNINLVERRSYGRVLTGEGELKIVELVAHNESPVWITHYDRDVVPFYQKPDPNNSERVLNADLILPSIKGSFGGEVLGLGQRQNSIEELKESMERQEVHHREAYDWYLKLRRHPKYQTTSGFGLGIERLLAWILGLESIVDASIYPVIKSEKIEY